MRNKKRSKYLLLLILLLAVSVGYALLSTTLKINGSATVAKNIWEVYWTNVQVEPGSVNASTNIPALSAESSQTLNTIVTWSTTLNLPGDYYEFTVDAVNNGTIDAMVTGINPTVTPALQDYIKYTVTYDNGVEVAENHLLAKKTGNTPTVQKYKIRIEFLDTITPTQMNNIPEGGLSYTFSYGVTYGQAAGDTIDPAGLIASCPGCVFEYFDAGRGYYWEDLRIYRGNPSVVTTYTTDYRTLSKNVFLGYVLDNNNTITRGFVCGIKNQVPFCLEGGEHEKGMALLQSPELWNGSCSGNTCGEDDDYKVTIGGYSWDIYDINGDYCFIDYDGVAYADASDSLGCYNIFE